MPRPLLPAARVAVLVVLAACGADALGAQGTGATRPLSFDEFYRLVHAAHPVARQARLAADQAGEELRVARGAFDPTLQASWSQKTFGGTEYYDYAEASLKVPTPLGADLKLGYERAAGSYVNPDRRTPAPGLVTAGLSIPLGQRILTDERRNAVAVARALRDAAEGDRAAAVNRLLLQATRDYARWYEAWRRTSLTRENVALAEFRAGAVRRRFELGEVPAIDTLEALLEVQRRAVQRAEAEQELFAAMLRVSAHLWDERGEPLDLPAGAVPSDAGLAPEPLDSAVAPDLLARAARQHPELRRIGGRVAQAEAQRRFAAQQVIPFVEGELSALSAGTRSFDVGGAGDAGENLKAGVTLRTPLLFVRERGRVNAASMRLEQQRLEAAWLRRNVALAVRTALNDLSVVERLIAVQRATVEQSRLLRDGEQRKFENGESTLFLVNLRDRSVLDEALKLAALEAKYVGARAELAVAAGEPAMLPRP